MVTKKQLELMMIRRRIPADRHAAVVDVIINGLTVYEAEQRHNLPSNTLGRQVARMRGEMEYVKNLQS